MNRQIILFGFFLVVGITGLFAQCSRCDRSFGKTNLESAYELELLPHVEKLYKRFQMDVFKEVCRDYKLEDIDWVIHQVNDSGFVKKTGMIKGDYLYRVHYNYPFDNSYRSDTIQLDTNFMKVAELFYADSSEMKHRHMEYFFQVLHHEIYFVESISDCFTYEIDYPNKSRHQVFWNYVREILKN